MCVCVGGGWTHVCYTYKYVESYVSASGLTFDPSSFPS